MESGNYQTTSTMQAANSTTMDQAQHSVAHAHLRDDHSSTAHQQKIQSAGLRQRALGRCVGWLFDWAANRPRLYGFLIALRRLHWRMEVERKLHEGYVAVDFGPAGRTLLKWIFDFV